MTKPIGIGKLWHIVAGHAAQTAGVDVNVIKDALGRGLVYEERFSSGHNWTIPYSCSVQRIRHAIEDAIHEIRSRHPIATL